MSAAPLFEWFKGDRARRRKFVQAGYTDGRITNWKNRGIPRAEVGAVAQLMGVRYEDYLERAGVKLENKAQEPRAVYGVSDEALAIARAFDQLQPQAREFIREQVFIYTVIDKSFPWLRRGRPVGTTYEQFEKWHQENITQAMKSGARDLGEQQAARLKPTGVKK